MNTRVFILAHKYAHAFSMNSVIALLWPRSCKENHVLDNWNSEPWSFIIIVVSMLS